MAAPRPEHAHATDRPATATLPPRPAHTTTGWRQDRRPVVSKRPLHSLAAAKMSPHIHIGLEPVLAAHARSPPAAGSRCPAGADSAPHSEQNYNRRDRRASQKSVKNGDSSKYCVREFASVAMHWQRGAVHHLYRWLPEAEEHSGPRGLWQSSILRREQSSPALGVPHAFKWAQQVRSYNRS